MLTYSRSKGLFVGIDMGGSSVERDQDSTLALCGKELTSTQVLTGKVAAPVDRALSSGKYERLRPCEPRSDGVARNLYSGGPAPA